MNRSQIAQDMGMLTVSRKVVLAIVHREASQVPGVVQLGGDSVLKRVFRWLGLRPRPRGVELELGDGEAAMSITVVVRYGTNVPDLVAEMRRRVKGALKVMAGIDARTINVYVKSVKPGPALYGAGALSTPPMAMAPGATGEPHLILPPPLPPPLARPITPPPEPREPRDGIRRRFDFPDEDPPRRSSCGRASRAAAVPSRWARPTGAAAGARSGSTRPSGRR